MISNKIADSDEDATLDAPGLDEMITEAKAKATQPAVNGEKKNNVGNGRDLSSVHDTKWFDLEIPRHKRSAHKTLEHLIRGTFQLKWYYPLLISIEWGFEGGHCPRSGKRSDLGYELNPSLRVIMLNRHASLPRSADSGRSERSHHLRHLCRKR